MATKRISELLASTALDGTELIEVSQVSATVTITAATISAAAADNSFNDSGNGFISAGFVEGDRVRVTGFTGDTANNILSGAITDLTAGKMVIGGTDGDVIVDDAAGESVTISKWVTRRATAQEIGDLGAGGGGGGIEEAPEDGNTYGRKDAAWEEITGGTLTGEPVPFVGARAKRTADVTINGVAVLAFTAEDYDYGVWHDNTTNNTRMTVPDGVTKVILTGQVDFQSTGNRTAYFLKNGTGTQIATQQVGNSAFSFTVVNLSSGVLECVPGDYFELVVETGSSQVINGDSARTWFAIEAVAERVVGSDLSVAVNTQTGGSYTLAETDNNDVVERSNAGANTVTIPSNGSVGLPVGFMVSIVQIGAGATTVQAAAGVTLNGVSEGEATLSGQWTGVSLYKRGTDAWVIQGDHGGVS